MTQNSRAVTIFAGVVVSIAVSAAAQNQVFNGNFARDLHGWTANTIYMAWLARDASAPGFSGSLYIINPLQLEARGVEQCLSGPAIVAGASYTFGAKIEIPSYEVGTGFAGVGVRWYSQPACMGALLADQPRADSSTADFTFHSVAWTGPAPAGAVSAALVVDATKTVAGGIEGLFTAYIDDLYFGPATTTTATSPALYVPTAAHLVGFGGVSWRTDLEVYNPTQGQISYTIELLKRDQANVTPLVLNDSLAAGASRRYVDIVFEGFGFTGAAALRVTPTSGALTVTSRTYNQTDTGTFGQYVPGIPDYEARVGGRLIQLTHDPSTTSGYRTNVGFLNAVNMPITIQVSLFNQSGTLLGTLTYDLQPYEFKQIDKIFKNVTSDPVADGYAILRTNTIGARFFAYASVIDNATSDPICVQPEWY